MEQTPPSLVNLPMPSPRRRLHGLRGILPCLGTHLGQQSSMRTRTLQALLLMLAVLGMRGALGAQTTFRDAGIEAYRRGDFAAAVTYYEKSLATALKIMKEDDIDLVERRAELGEAYRAAGRWDDAITQLDYVWKRARYDAENRHHWLEDEGDMTMGFAEKLGKSCLAAARYDDGIMVFKTSMADAERVGRIANALQFGALLADALFQTHKHEEEATATVRHVAELANKLQGNVVLQARAFQQLASLCLRQKLPDAAKPLAEHALELAQQVPASNDFLVSEYQETLASALLATNGLDEAEKLLDAATKEILTKETGDSPRLVEVLLDDSTLALKRNLPQDALNSAEQALILSRKRFKDQHPQTARCIAQVAKCEMALNEPEKARPLFAQALAIMNKTLGEDHPETKDVRDESLKLGPRLSPAKSSAAPAPDR
jgi:tetratricopeptide (TPR) repeat protein